MDRPFVQRGDAPAVRCKERGQLRTHGWSALRARSTAPTHTLGLAWVESQLAALQAVDGHGWGSEDIVWIEPALAERDPRLLGMWLASGAVLAVDETRDGDDRRELAPTVVVASALYYQALARESAARLERSPLRSLSRWALARAGNPLARALILRPVADQLGLARVRRTLSVDAVDTETRTWFAALGLAITPIEHAPRSTQVEEPLVIREARA